ncbi:MAG: flagellar biosynthetic protein FliR [Candidatus Margulisbacteria bacterium]|nr:flagellar biosynthetic protein FliR [Candidatus Margulisiibacteriota bacterium]
MIISVEQLVVFLLIVGRIAGIFIQAPIFNSRSFPFLAKTSIAVWSAIVLWFVTPIHQPLPQTFSAFVLAMIFEVVIGFIIGFVCNIIFIAIQSAGEIMDMQMGLSVATALDPVFGSVISVVGRLAFFFALMVFIGANGHHLILSGLHQSFTALPVGKIANISSPNLVVQMISLGSALWATAITVAIPVVLLIFISDFTFGIVSRVAPQVNVFMLGFQVKPSLGIFGLMMLLPFLLKYINHLVEFMAEQLILLASAIK